MRKYADIIMVVNKRLYMYVHTLKQIALHVYIHTGM